MNLFEIYFEKIHEIACSSVSREGKRIRFERINDEQHKRVCAAISLIHCSDAIVNRLIQNSAKAKTPAERARILEKIKSELDSLDFNIANIPNAPK